MKSETKRRAMTWTRLGDIMGKGAAILMIVTCVSMTSALPGIALAHTLGMDPLPSFFILVPMGLAVVGGLFVLIFIIGYIVEILGFDL